MSKRWTVVKGGSVLAEGWKTSESEDPWVEFCDVSPDPGRSGSIAIFETEEDAKEAAIATSARTAEIMSNPAGGSGFSIVLSKVYPGQVKASGRSRA